MIRRGLRGVPSGYDMAKKRGNRKISLKGSGHLADSRGPKAPPESGRLPTAL